MRASALSTFAAAILFAAAPSAAADDTVGAGDPEGIVKVMREAGYVAELVRDGYGDPLIKTTFATYAGSIYFYGCDKDAHASCDSIQFRAGLDRKQPMPAELLTAILRKYRYAAVWLDAEGDPWVNFDIYTGAGVSREVFLGTLKAFTGNFAAVADDTFAEERGE